LQALLLADRAVVLERGRIRTELPIPLQRPRRHADPRPMQLRAALLESLGVHDA
jgi:sulfonate transport system ATP-binding protein